MVSIQSASRLRSRRQNLIADIRFLPENLHTAIVAVAASVVGCTLAVVTVDAAFRSSLTSQYVAVFTGPQPGLTTLVMMIEATRDESLGRLLLVGGMVVIARVVLRGRAIPLAVLAAIFVAAQVLILLPQLPAPATTTEVAYDALRYVGPGVLWGWLFWRHGFVAALVGHAGTHLALDPALRVLLAPLS